MSPRRRTLLVVGVVLVLLAGLVGVLLTQGAGGPAAVATARPGRSSASGLPLCGPVPSQVNDAVLAVRSNGPYLRPRADGGTFGNREGLLPARPRGYYREYTVSAPGQRFPGPRRLITGGQEALGAEPEIWFYSADHYESFCELAVS